jgi:hypothetical protein
MTLPSAMLTFSFLCLPDVEYITRETKYYKNNEVTRVVNEVILQGKKESESAMKENHHQQQQQQEQQPQEQLHEHQRELPTKPLPKLVKGRITTPVIAKQIITTTKLNPVLSKFIQAGKQLALPTALLLISSAIWKTPPLNKQRIPLVTPFFQGWLIRMVDSNRGISCTIIVGSYSPSMSTHFQQHYLFASVNVKGKTYSHEEFPDPNKISIKNLDKTTTNIIWQSEQFGYFHIANDHAQLHFQFPELDIFLSSADRVPWNKKPSSSSSSSFLSSLFSDSGPQGWLGRTPPFLLPSQYAVHSVGSSTDYKIQIHHQKQVEQRRKGWVSSSPATPSLSLSGTGESHIESNSGHSFPKGWFWSQGSNQGENVSFVLSMTECSFGPLPSSIQPVLFFRKPSGERVIFRYIDFDQISYSLDGISRKIVIQANSFLKGKSMNITIEQDDSYHQSRRKKELLEPWQRICSPSVEGYNHKLGCEGNYNMKTKIFISDVRVPDIVEEYTIPFTAVEFGGSFLNQIRSNFPTE